MFRYTSQSFASAIVLAAIFGGALSFSGCDSGPMACTEELVPGVAIRVFDAESGLPAACGATGYLVSDSYSEELVSASTCSLPDSLQDPELRGAFERPGLYSVVLIKEGYRRWSRSGIIVRQGVCHVSEVKLEARLSRVD